MRGAGVGEAGTCVVATREGLGDGDGYGVGDGEGDTCAIAVDDGDGDAIATAGDGGDVGLPVSAGTGEPQAAKSSAIKSHSGMIRMHLLISSSSMIRCRCRWHHTRRAPAKADSLHSYPAPSPPIRPEVNPDEGWRPWGGKAISPARRRRIPNMDAVRRTAFCLMIQPPS